MSQTVDVGTPPAPARDERVARRSTLSRMLARPEVGALAGAIVIFLIFFIVAPPFRDANALATVLYVSSTYGIPAVAVALLMIGGEFDLSAGVAEPDQRRLGRGVGCGGHLDASARLRMKLLSRMAPSSSAPRKK